MIEYVYCYRCLQVRPCKVVRTIDGWSWVCEFCGCIADNDYCDDRECEWEPH